ncbi:MAG: DUF6588 family protein [Bacteroidota bacterium]
MKNLTNVLLTILFFLVFAIPKVKAQDEMTVFVNESIEDAENVMNAYGSPLLRSLGTNFNAGWLNTAEVMNFGQFDVRLVGTAAFAPNKDKTFAPADYGLDSQETSNIFTDEPVLPTIFGEMQDAQVTVRAKGPDDSELRVVGTYTVPTLEVGGSPMLMPQVNFGFVEGTEIMIRGLPPVKLPTYEELDKLTTSYFAVGLKHDIKQWIPAVRSLPFSWSVYGGWSNSNLYYDGPFLIPEDIIGNTDMDEVEYAEGEEQYQNEYGQQRMSFETNGITLGTMVSKRFPVVTLFGGMEYNTSTTGLLFEGAYPYVNFDEEFEHLVDELNVSGKQTNFGVTGGVRVKLFLLSITASGTYMPDAYSSITLAVGVGNF